MAESQQQQSYQTTENDSTGGPELDPLAVKVERLETENEELRRKLKEAQETTAWLEDLVSKNPHTLLPIRRMFDRAVAGLLDPERRDGTRGMLAIGVLRLDRAYDRIKDTRDRGKALLFNTSDRLKGLLGEYLFQSDRLDEFLFAIPAMSDHDAVELVASRIVEAVSRPHEPPAKDVVFGCHLGLSVNTGGLTKEELLGNAYIALAESEAGRGRYVIYDESIGNSYRQKAEIERSLATVAQSGFEDFRLMYQPFVNAEGTVIGAEALIRWFHPRLGPLSPSLFVPVAEETGDIRLLGQWTLYNAARQLREWTRGNGRDLHMSINLSPAQFKQQDLIVRVEGIIEALELDEGQLKLELTEGAVMEDPDDAVRTMAMLDERGVRISIDDFGTGYSSLSYLKRFPVHTLKIDRSFIEDVNINESNQEIVRAIISMARSLHIESLAEGVETVEQRDFLVAEGVDAIQGYLYSPPVPARDFEPFLQAGQIEPRVSVEP